jgi:uncharacterized phage infection (PIP) family protein YhgE
MTLLLKSIKRAQKKEAALTEQISLLERGIQDNNDLIGKYNVDSEELADISEDNFNNYNNMLDSISRLEHKAKDYEESMELLLEDIDNENKMIRDMERPKYHMQLQQGIKEL